MCKQCPRKFRVKRYWDLPHWVSERTYLEQKRQEEKRKADERFWREFNEQD